MSNDPTEIGHSETPNDRKRCGFVAVIGAPNAGKSTLVNTMVGGKVTIVSHKVQTTRTPLKGITIVGTTQLVFIDTPGIFKPKRKLDRAMVDAAFSGAHGADIVLLVIDATQDLDEAVTEIRDQAYDIKAPLIIALNKIDQVADKQKLLTYVQALSAQGAATELFMISATTGDGVDDLRAYLSGASPEGPWHFAEDDMSDAPMRVLAAEITREKIYQFLHQELPYATTVETTEWKELKDGSARIEQTIFVERPGQKSIVLGKNGQSIKRISSASRQELCAVLDRKVHLFVFVKVKENWTSDPERFREMGLEFPKDN